MRRRKRRIRGRQVPGCLPVVRLATLCRNQVSAARTPVRRPLTADSITLTRCSSFMPIVTRPGLFMAGSAALRLDSMRLRQV